MVLGALRLRLKYAINLSTSLTDARACTSGAPYSRRNALKARIPTSKVCIERDAQDFSTNRLTSESRAATNAPVLVLVTVLPAAPLCGTRPSESVKAHLR